MNAILALLAVANPPTDAPLHCPAPLVAKGDIKGGPPFAQTFELTHRGTSTLTITKVEAGCGCVHRALSATTLNPGETAKLTLEVNTLTQPDGPNRWQAVVSYSLDGTEPKQSGELAVAVTAKLSREVSVNPPQVGFSTAGEAAQTLTVTDRRRKPLTVTKAIGSSPHLTATIAAPLLESNGTHSQKIGLKLSADAPAGHRDEVIVLQTDDKEYPEFRVPVRVLKKSPGTVGAAPEEVAVRFAAGQEEVSSLVQLRSPDGKNLRIESATCELPAVTAKFSAEAGPVATVRVIVGGAAVAQAGSTVVRVRLAEPAGQIVAIPVSWTSATKK